jgi:hypothetical protein
MVFKYKRVELEIDGSKWKVWKVLADDITKGYIDKDEDFGYIFYESLNHEWLLGLETLRECKENLEELINKGKI